MAKEKIVLAYSGGLDTSVILKWLKETYDAEIIAFTADIGQKDELDGLEAKALATGASKVYIDDLRDEFAKDFIFTETKRLEFRWESFNFLNHANLALPVNTVDAPTAGRILGLAGSQSFGGAGTNPMRRMQFGLRFSW